MGTGLDEALLFGMLIIRQVTDHFGVCLAVYFFSFCISQLEMLAAEEDAEKKGEHFCKFR